jgi:hypothetical protein
MILEANTKKNDYHYGKKFYHHMFDLNFYNQVLKGVRAIFQLNEIRYVNTHQGFITHRDNIPVRRHLRDFQNFLDGKDISLYFQIYFQYFNLEEMLIKKMEKMMYNIAFD